MSVVDGTSMCSLTLNGETAVAMAMLSDGLIQDYRLWNWFKRVGTVGSGGGC